MTLVMQRESTEFIYLGVAGNVPSVGAECAFLIAGVRPTSGDWKTAIVVINGDPLYASAVASGATGAFYIAIKIGAFSGGTVTLTAGDYQVWVRLTDATEQPVRIAAEALEIA
jgi:hypothetical protein